MNEFILTFGVTVDITPGAVSSHDARQSAIITTAFTFGPAWHSRSSVHFSSNRDIDAMVAELVPLIREEDFIFLLQLAGPRAARYAGYISDDEGFRALYPEAVEFQRIPAERSDAIS